MAPPIPRKYLLAVKLKDGRKRVLPKEFTNRQAAEAASRKWREHPRVASVRVIEKTVANLDRARTAGFVLPPHLDGRR